ncbi:MAG: tetratricopeptide repeat protein, partial [Kiritimatiellae bacterium]|nr:tetratricopeptide repeat protein [Kiritimatiellia bacterium]
AGRLSAGDTVLGDGVLDDMLMLAAADREDGAPLVVTAPATGTASYRKWLAECHFTDTRSQALLDLGFGPFFQDFVRDGGGLGRVALLGSGERFRDLGEPIPEGVMNRLAAENPSGEALTALAAGQRAFWEKAVEIAEGASGGWARQRGRGNPARPFLEYVRFTASKQANNVAFLMLDEGRDAEAEELLLLARRIAPENPSVLLNLLTLARRRGETDTPYEAEWAEFMEDHRDDRALWALADRFGYVHNAGMLIRQGMMWAVSGRPRLAEAELRRSERKAGREAASPELRSFLGRMYMFSGDLEKGEEFYKDVLAERPDDLDAIHALAKLDIQRGETAAAAEKLARLEELGVPPERLAFERVLLQAADGDPRGALRMLAPIGRDQPDNLLVPVLTAFLAQETGNTELLDKTIEGLRRRPNKPMKLRLYVAQLLMDRQDWAGARSELEPLTRMNPGDAKVWELLLRTDYAERKRELAEDHVRVLLTLEPENALGNLMLASFQRERGQLALAESSYRTALKSERRPETLNDLADLLIRKGKDGRHEAALAEAAALLDEALAVRPGHLAALATRAELRLMRGELDAAETDIQRLLAEAPEAPEALLFSARLYAARGNDAAARDLAASLEARRDSMHPDVLEQFKEFQAELKKGTPAP